MSKKSSAYWNKRFEALETASNTYGQDAYRKIEPAFDKAQREIEVEIERWYGRIAKNNELDIVEARKLLNASELKEFKWDVQEYIRYGRENDLNQTWMKELENASAKYHISRLEALKLRTQNAMEVAFGNELDEIDSMARKVFSENYYHSIFEVQKGFNIGWEIGQIDERKLDKIISKPWTTDNKTFSDRVWNSKTQMVNELHQQMTRTFVLGKAPDEAIKEMSKFVDKKFTNTKFQAGRLVMTEQAYFHSISQKEAFEELDVEEFEVVATLDSHTSEICQDMDGVHKPMKEYEPGVTAPPFHVFCRSVTVPYFDDEFSLGERAARDADGKTYYVPSNMTYKDWKKSMVDGDTNGLKMASVGEKHNDWSKTTPQQVSKEEKKRLIEYAKSKGINVVDLSKFDGDSRLLEKQIDQLSELQNKYSTTGVHLKVDFMDDDDFAELKNNTIVLNTKALRNESITVSNILKDNYFASNSFTDIVMHEYGHVLAAQYGNKGVDIAQKVLYNIGEKIETLDDVIRYLELNVSKCSTKFDMFLFCTKGKKEYKEVVAEVFTKHNNAPTEFTKEFMKIFMKG